MTDENSADVQAQQTAAATQVEPVTPPEAPEGQPQHSGFQKRIDELTREKYDAIRRAEEVQKSYESILTSIATQRVQPQEPQVPAYEFDPEDRKRLDAYFAQSVQPHLKRMEAENAQLRSQIGQQAFQAIAAQEDPRVVKLANEYMANWQRSGKTGWVAEDAITYASGAIARQDRQAATQSRNARGEFNRMSQPLSGHSSAAPSATVPGALPANFEKLPPSQQAELLAKRLGDKAF